jgi:protein-histidine pros-kinase
MSDGYGEIKDASTALNCRKLQRNQATVIGHLGLSARTELVLRFSDSVQQSTDSSRTQRRRPSLKLLLKFNLIFLLLAGTGLAVVAHVAYRFLMENAKSQVVQQAQLMMESARATRDYTSEELKPLLAKVSAPGNEFIPQTVPAYGATQSFARLRKRYPEYTYKEAALNPTNPRNRAEDFEADIINSFRNHADETEIVGERPSPTGTVLYLAHPIQVKASCLECHDVPSRAPAALLVSYGASNGFGWKAGEINAAQIVSVPTAVPIGIADKAYRTLVLYLIVTFFFTLMAIDAALYFVVIRPVGKLSAMAERVSRGDLDIAEIPVSSKDEIGGLTASFNRMYVTVVKALRMLND